MINKSSDTLDLLNDETPCDVTPLLANIKAEDAIPAKKMLWILENLEIKLTTGGLGKNAYEYQAKGDPDNIKKAKTKLFNRAPPFSPFESNYTFKELEENKFQLEVGNSNFIITFESKTRD